VVYEKPYGTSPESFRELDELVLSVLDEEQVFRIDHFLGKEGTQDLHVLRFANALFEHVWHRDHVAQVQIDVPEDLDVADRAEFYDATGAALDMLVTHLFQVAAEVAMEPPASFSPADLQAAREGVLAAFRPLDPTRWCSASSTATPTSRAWPTTRRPTPTSPPGCGSTATAGAASRSCCGPASGWPRARSG
jgi:glucose-6-phosphate 1-dehydrogenase (EC 1.1.1.49)